MEKNYACVSQDLLSLQQMLKELEALATEKDTEASAIKDLKEEEMRNCDNDLLEAALKKERILNEYTKVLGQTLAEIDEKQEKCSVIQRRIESLDNGMNNLDIDDREDENDRRKIQSLRDQLAKDAEERKLVLKQMESQQHHVTTKSPVSIPAPINVDVDDRPKIQKHEDVDGEKLIVTLVVDPRVDRLINLRKIILIQERGKILPNHCRKLRQLAIYYQMRE